MNLPIKKLFESDYYLIPAKPFYEKIRVLDIDGTYIISTVMIALNTKEFILAEEAAFNDLQEVIDYLLFDMGIDKEKLQECIPGDFYDSRASDPT